MRQRVTLHQRYQIVDESTPPVWARFAVPPLILLPVTIYLMLSISVFFLLLPGVSGLILGGNHRWRDVGLSFLALVLFISGVVTNGLLIDAGMLDGLALDYARDFVLALGVFPLIKVMLDQQHTIFMRKAMQA